MPTYSYSCKKCKHTWDIFQGIEENRLAPPKKCPACGSGAIRKDVGGGANVRFKIGRGSYNHDYNKRKWD